MEWKIYTIITLVIIITLVPCLGKRKKKNMSPISSAPIIILGLLLLCFVFFFVVGLQILQEPGKHTCCINKVT